MQVEQIWKQFHHNLSGFIASSIGDEGIAEDIVQDIFLKLVEKPLKIDSPENLRPYLFAMAKNAIIDHYRTTKKNAPVFSFYSEINFAPAEYQLADCCLRPMIENLPTIYREALLLSEIDGVSQKEIAKRLEISYSGVKSRVQRGRQLLKQAILNCCNYQFDKFGNITACLPKLNTSCSSCN